MANPHFPKRPPVKASTLAVPQARKQTVAPPVYKPQPIQRVLQRTTALKSTRAAAPTKPASPVAPPVYRPQPVPRVLQTKTAIASQYGTRSHQAPTPPPPYSPQKPPRVLQRKLGETPPAHANQIGKKKVAVSSRAQDPESRSKVIQQHQRNARSGPNSSRQSNAAIAAAHRMPPIFARVIQRHIDAATRVDRVDFQLAVAANAEWDEAQNNLGNFVAQDAQPYVGGGMAHTSNLATCAALAMRSNGANISFLFHADATSASARIVGYVNDFSLQVKTALGLNGTPLDALLSNDVEIWVFSPAGNVDSSVRQIRDALHTVGGGALLAKVHYQEESTNQGRATYTIGREHRIVVGGGLGPRVAMNPAHQVNYLLQNYLGANQQTVVQAGDALIAHIAGGCDQSRVTDGDLYEAAEKAFINNQWRLFSALAALTPRSFMQLYEGFCEDHHRRPLNPNAPAFVPA
ncbi:MAG TPA: hypothetical protein DC054_23930 [Blastocatellia bacterium]|nr:hypothetical protein [Blastocatellia bacterium]